VATALRCTTTKVSYIENAERPIVLGISTRCCCRSTTCPRIAGPSTSSRRELTTKGWWESYDADTVPDWFSLYVGLEQGCAQIRLYQAQLVPGLLQTEDYAEAIVRRGIAEPTTEQVACEWHFAWHGRKCCARETSPLRLWAC